MRALVPIVVAQAESPGRTDLIIRDDGALDELQRALWALASAAGAAPTPDLIDLHTAQVLALYAAAAAEWQKRAGTVSPAGHICVVRVGEATFVLGSPRILVGALGNPASTLNTFIARHERE
jgi:hypothetical protein